VISIPPGVRVLLATRPVDFRKGSHGLAALAAEVLGEDPFSGAVIVFRSKRADRIKILVWDGSGLVLVWKRLSHGASLAASGGWRHDAVRVGVRGAI
jgi:transposase